MKNKTQDLEDWRDGFLFVGNQIALDLLNTSLVPDGTTAVEMLPDTAALERWMSAAGLLTTERGLQRARQWRDAPETQAFLAELKAFRERLRAAVFQYEAGSAIPGSFLSELNQLLWEYPVRTKLLYQDGALQRETDFEPSAPAQLWAPIAATAADLLIQISPSRVRKCESCAVHFHDVSKKNSRRWCSMNLCGNKIKVAAYRQRQMMRADHPEE